jgi:dipeptidyl aminopeptidase/acylaminoacyl peptidase
MREGARRLRAAGLMLAGVALAGSTWFLVGRRPEDPKAAWKAFPPEELWGSGWGQSRSPDGRLVAYLENSDLLVRPSEGGGAPRRLTSDGEPKSYPAWSPDGRTIAFYRHEEVFLIPAGGGPERKAGWTLHPAGLAWSRDGQALLLPDKDSLEEAASLYLRSLATGKKRRLTAPPDNTPGDQLPAPSPEGERLAFVRVREDRAADVYIMPLYDDAARVAAPRRLTFWNQAISALWWTGDGKRLVLAAGTPGAESATHDLWVIPETGGRPDRFR